MASATIELTRRGTEGTYEYALVGSGVNEAAYRVATNDPNSPQTLDFKFITNPAGSKSNDRTSITLRISKPDAETGEIGTATLKVEVSQPRVGGLTAGDVQDLYAQIGKWIGTDAVNESLQQQISV